MKLNHQQVQHARTAMRGLVWAVAFVGLIVAPDVFADTSTDFGNTDDKVCKFFNNINGLLNIASIAVVTIAVVFAGYQIAFAHKRIGEVAPILIGGLLIGAAGQIARMLLGDGSDSSCAAPTTFGMLQHAGALVGLA